MVWNWQLPNWPHFTYRFSAITLMEEKFLIKTGGVLALLKTLNSQDYYHFIVDILTEEGQESAKIEGEWLHRESLHSSIKRHFGLQTPFTSSRPKESGMAEALCDVYESFQMPLTHEMLGKWHHMLFKKSEIEAVGKYRTHSEPMQIVSGRLDSQVVYFEAPSSKSVYKEMSKFIEWFNSSDTKETILERAAIAHVYFESIHPFEDGNGRIGRLLIEKALSQGLEKAVVLSISKIFEKRKKDYYAALGMCNKTLEITPWMEFFGKVVMEAAEDSQCLLNFLLAKAKLLRELKDQLNSRQEKALLRMFDEGPSGFKGGLSAENYMAITKASRATATRDLADLVEKKALFKTGQLRHTRYWLNP